METDPLLGKQLGAYLIQNKLGEGGMSRVYKGFHARLRRDVAIKVILSEIAASPDFRARFEREAQLIASLEHPNIVTVYDFGESDNITYLVMQYVSGGTLRDRLRGGQPIEPRRAVYYALQMARALHHAHLRGIVHRDVKPQNMLVSANDPDTLLLSDFGIAKLFDSSHEVTWTGSIPMNMPASHSITFADQIVGTADYMAPEQVNQQLVDARTDVYALGVVLFQMLTGRVPFQSTSLQGLLYQHVYIVPLSLRETNPNVPEPLAQITAQALAKAPSARFQSADAMAQALEAIISSTPTIRSATLGDTSPSVYPNQQRAVTDAGDICPNCGIVLDSDSSFCPNCGYFLLAKTSQHEQTQFSIGQPAVQSPSPTQSGSDIPTMHELPVPVEEPNLTRAFPIGKCPYCGAETRPKDNFCLNCGNRLLPVASSAQQAQPMIGDWSDRGNHTLAGSTAVVEDLPTIDIPEQIDAGTIGTRFMQTAESPFDTASAAPATPPGTQAPVEEPVSLTPDAAAYVPPLPDSTFALDQTIAQLLEDGESHYRARRYEDALTVYIRIIRMDPRNVLAHGNRGNVLGKLGQYKEAVAAYDVALGIDAKHVSIWNAKGDILFKLRRYEEALKAYNAALSIKPNDGLTLTTKGDVLSRMRRYEEALAACNQALSITATHTQTWITKGNVLTKQRRYDEALVAYDAALAINPRDAATWITKGNVLSKLERYEEALVAYTWASDLAPRKPQIWATKGEVLLQLKRYDEALVAYERAHILNPGDTAIARKCTLLRDLKRHKDELAQAQVREKPDEAQSRQQPGTATMSDNEPGTQQRRDAAAQDQEQKESIGQGVDSTRVLEVFDIFLSYADLDAEWEKWVEEHLANRLEDEHGFRVWLPKWWLIPGMRWQPEWDRGMEQSRCYAICVSGQTSIDWFKQEVQKALKRKQQVPSFRVLAVLLPDAQDIDVDAFPELSTWVYFRNVDHAYAFHVLVCGVKGVPPGPPPKTRMDTTSTWTGTIAEARLRELQQFKQGKLIDDSVAQEFQRIVLKKVWLDIEESKG
jgi:serine/threonine protein kinase/tetratricopeptide (TPR) repeat protein